jgi:hypothetical protein
LEDGCTTDLNADGFNVKLLDLDSSLFTRDIIKEPSTIKFLSEQVKKGPGVEKQPCAVVERSKSDANVAHLRCDQGHRNFDTSWRFSIENKTGSLKIGYSDGPVLKNVKERRKLPSLTRNSRIKVGGVPGTRSWPVYIGILMC